MAKGEEHSKTAGSVNRLKFVPNDCQVAAVNVQKLRRFEMKDDLGTSFSLHPGKGNYSLAIW